MIKVTLLFLGGILWCFTVYAQDGFKADADKIFVSSNGNVCLLKGATLTETDWNGKELKRFSLSPPDIIDYCDVTNPLEVLLFIRSGNRLCILDNKYTPISDIYLPLGEAFVYLVCSSSHGGMWYFDALSRQLIHEEKGERRMLVSGPFYGFPGYKNDLPVGMSETRDFVLVTFPESGLMLFDRNGTYIRSVEFKGYQYLGMSRNEVYYGNEGHVICYDAVKDEKKELDFDFNIIQLYSTAEQWVVFDGKNIFFKKVKQD